MITILLWIGRSYLNHCLSMLLINEQQYGEMIYVYIVI